MRPADALPMIEAALRGGGVTSHYRVHHAANPAYLDANYGGASSLSGIGLFGTFIEQRADLPCRYGLVRPLRSNNPFAINAHEWAALARDLWQAKSCERWHYLFGPPGWQPNGQERTTQDRRRVASAAE
jgi:hypothetical protein